MIPINTLKIPQYLEIDTEEGINQLKVYRDASVEFLQETDIDKAIYYRFHKNHNQVFWFNMLYMTQAVVVSLAIIYDDKNARNCQ